MTELYFLFALAILWTTFAAIQDIKTREVSNWLNFSLIAFALAYRAFYSISNKNPQFFLLGLYGFIIFFILAHVFYYGRAFAGGDAKLLMGLGIILPYTSYKSLFTLSITFIFLLFLVGAIYSIIYSTFIVAKNKEKFIKTFKKYFRKNPILISISLISFLIFLSLSYFIPLLLPFAIILLIPSLFIYTKSLDKCMIKYLPPNKLTEGDWILNDIKVGKKTIKKTVHGLSAQDIKLLKKHNKKILVKDGVPFVPAFLISLLIMVFFEGILSLSLESLLPL